MARERRIAILREIGEVLRTTFDGRLEHAIEAAGQDALEISRFLVEHFPSYRDACNFKGRSVSLCKRAQLASGMLHGARLARGSTGLARAAKLTVYADYILPAILRFLGVSSYTEDLATTVDGHKEMPAGCRFETEIRISTIAAGEIIVQAALKYGLELTALQLDYWLWRSGFGILDKSPHHRVVTTNY